mmetsp:Transcript_35813/g.65007  ORF Transcript_35813/g.65007 Transcript_35813/m.65007 type:complete len:202 (-) Transcript_35813:149-754(-)
MRCLFRLFQKTDHTALTQVLEIGQDLSGRSICRVRTQSLPSWVFMLEDHRSSYALAPRAIDPASFVLDCLGAFQVLLPSLSVSGPVLQESSASLVRWPLQFLTVLFFGLLECLRVGTITAALQVLNHIAHRPIRESRILIPSIIREFENDSSVHCFCPWPGQLAPLKSRRCSCDVVCPDLTARRVALEECCVIAFGPLELH